MAKTHLNRLICAGLLFLLPFSLLAEGYLEQLPRFWRGLYPDGGETLYCGIAFRPFDKAVNVEHIFPMAWVTKALGCGDRKQCRANSERFNQIEADMHNLYPALKEINKARGTLAYGDLAGERWLREDCDFEINKRLKRVEPRAEVQGDIARAMFYMSSQYDLEIYDRQRRTLLRWHEQDPPSVEERRRNDVIERLQGNRNPYIDRPDSLR